MSDLAATNCQPSCGSGCDCGLFSNNCLWLILILLFCNGHDSDCDCGCNNIIWIILLLCCCGNGSGFNFGCC
ncbi:MAG: chorion class high-cysteine HCB protein 13 [Eubacterium sp.]|nr:chorion class high-cysteine HCB protein 13 [Eubacterium sp.]